MIGMPTIQLLHSISTFAQPAPTTNRVVPFNVFHPVPKHKIHRSLVYLTYFFYLCNNNLPNHHTAS